MEIERMTAQGQSGGKLVCRTCRDEDGVASSRTVQHRCTNERTQKTFDAFVCARCLEAGRETRVTCRTFVRAEQPDRPRPTMSSIDGNAKRDALLQLARKRQEATFERYTKRYFNLADFHGGYYETDHVVPWTISACNVDAELMLICQDWASSDFLNKPRNPEQKKSGHDATLPTNINIKEILREHFDLSFADTYATDVFPFIKEGAMDAKIPPRDLVRSASEYALPQIEIVRPKMVICLGSDPFNALRYALNKGKRIPMERAYMVETPFHTEFAGIPIFGVVHVGGQATAFAGGKAVLRPRWQALGAYFRSIGTLPAPEVG
ncbi:hypothetical protein ACQR1H_31390 [Bradyrhizobium sp. HKCCYLRH2015]|uniref:hypothetical protein n=1 Tax=Bradyrhizobium sp. HKCCYLRH2015 TaxID=3420742 RepID=UPI003EBDF3BB